MEGSETQVTLEKKAKILHFHFINLGVVIVIILLYLFSHLLGFFFLFMSIELLKNRKGKTHTLYIVLYPVFSF